MRDLSLTILAFVLFAGFGNAQAVGRNCAKVYNDCRNALFSDKKVCNKKRDKCDAENAQAETVATQNTTKNRMLNGGSTAGNSMRPSSRYEDSVEARREAARRRIMDRENETAQAPQKSMRDNVNSH